jgi:hypothetical protein
MASASSADMKWQDLLNLSSAKLCWDDEPVHLTQKRGFVKEK